MGLSNNWLRSATLILLIGCNLDSPARAGDLHSCIVENLGPHLQRLKTENLRDDVPANFFDRELAAAYKNGTLDLSKAPGKWFEIKTGSLSGRSIHYVDLKPETAGPEKGTWVLLGGLGYHARRWNQSGMVDTLRANGYRVVVIDPPGQGWTLLRHLVEDGSSPGFLRTPGRYEKEDQAAAIHDLLSHLKETGTLGKNTYLAGESYGGWLTSYLGTLPKFKNLLKAIVPIDPGMANTTHLLQGADAWNTMREALERLSPELAKMIPEKMPGSNQYKEAKALLDKMVLEMKSHPSAYVQIQGQVMQNLLDLQFKALMDSFIPKASRKRSPVRYSGVVPSFNGIREYDAPANAGDIKIPTYLIEAGKGEAVKGVPGGLPVVPHIQHKEFAKNNPNLVGWYRLENVPHDMPVEAGSELAQLMIAIAENRVKEIPQGVRIDIDPKKDLRHILKDQPEKPVK